jgi:hypothetical protein
MTALVTVGVTVNIVSNDFGLSNFSYIEFHGSAASIYAIVQLDSF